MPGAAMLGPALRRPSPPDEFAAVKNISDPAFFKLFCIGSRKAMAVSSKTSSTNCDAGSGRQITAIAVNPANLQ
jgi:hypothetical protein